MGQSGGTLATNWETPETKPRKKKPSNHKAGPQVIVDSAQHDGGEEIEGLVAAEPKMVAKILDKHTAVCTRSQAVPREIIDFHLTVFGTEDCLLGAVQALALCPGMGSLLVSGCYPTGSTEYGTHMCMVFMAMLEPVNTAMLPSYSGHRCIRAHWECNRALHQRIFRGSHTGWRELLYGDPVSLNRGIRRFALADSLFDVPNCIAEIEQV